MVAMKRRNGRGAKGRRKMDSERTHGWKENRRQCPGKPGLEQLQGEMRHFQEDVQQAHRGGTGFQPVCLGLQP